MALSLASGFDDARALKPYAFQVREVLFIVLWFVGQRHWTFWFFPAFVLVRSYTILARRLDCERFMICAWIFVWLFLPLVIQSQPVPLPSAANPVEKGPCLPVYEFPWFKTLMEWSFGDTVIRQGPRTFAFAPCYWLGFYRGSNAMKKLCSIVNIETRKRLGLVALCLAAYLGIGFGWGFGLELLETRNLAVPWSHSRVVSASYDDLCTSFYAWGLARLPLRMLLNWLHLAITIFLSVLYVMIVALVPGWHLKTLAKTSFSALILHGFTPCLLNIQGWCVDVLAAFGPGFHTEALQMLIWFSIPTLYVWIVGQLMFHVMRGIAVRRRYLFVCCNLLSAGITSGKCKMLAVQSTLCSKPIAEQALAQK